MKKILSKELIINLLIVFVMFLALLLIVNWSLKIYTRHGQSITVPDIKGKTLDQALSILDKADLEYKILDSTFLADQKPNSILEQTPKAGNKVKKGRTIYLTVNAFNAPKVAVPDLVGKSSFKYAQMQLEGLGLKVDTIFKPSPYNNAVLEILYKGGKLTPDSKISKGESVTIVIGRTAASIDVQIPYLIGLSYQDAKQKIESELGLAIGALVVDAGVVDTLNAIVYRQSPEFFDGRTLSSGQEIDLFISKTIPEDIEVKTELYNISNKSTEEE